jgi:hypothetical protein
MPSTDMRGRIVNLAAEIAHIRAAVGRERAGDGAQRAGPPKMRGNMTDRPRASTALSLTGG